MHGPKIEDAGLSALAALLDGSNDEAKARLSDAAGHLVEERLRFATPFVLAALGSFMVITLLAGFTTFFDNLWVGPFSLLSVLLMSYVPLSCLMTWIYSRRAHEWDVRSAELLGKLTGEA